MIFFIAHVASSLPQTFLSTDQAVSLKGDDTSCVANTEAPPQGCRCPASKLNGTVDCDEGQLCHENAQKVNEVCRETETSCAKKAEKACKEKEQSVLGSKVIKERNQCARACGTPADKTAPADKKVEKVDGEPADTKWCEEHVTKQCAQQNKEFLRFSIDHYGKCDGKCRETEASCTELAKKGCGEENSPFPPSIKVSKEGENCEWKCRVTEDECVELAQKECAETKKLSVRSYLKVIEEINNCEYGCEVECTDNLNDADRCTDGLNLCSAEDFKASTESPQKCPEKPALEE